MELVINIYVSTPITADNEDIVFYDQADAGLDSLHHPGFFDRSSDCDNYLLTTIESVTTNTIVDGHASSYSINNNQPSTFKRRFIMTTANQADSCNASTSALDLVFDFPKNLQVVSKYIPLNNPTHKGL